MGGCRNGRWKLSGCDRNAGGNRGTDGLACSRFSAKAKSRGGRREGKLCLSHNRIAVMSRVGRARQERWMDVEGEEGGQRRQHQHARTYPTMDVYPRRKDFYHTLVAHLCVRDMDKGGEGTVPNEGGRRKGACRWMLRACIVGRGCASVPSRGSQKRERGSVEE